MKTQLDFSQLKKKKKEKYQNSWKSEGKKEQFLNSPRSLLILRPKPKQKIAKN